jgi:integrase
LTPYRSALAAQAAVRGASASVRGDSRPGQLRFPFNATHLVVTGVAAYLLAKVGDLGKNFDIEACGATLAEFLGNLAPAGDDSSLLDCLSETAQIDGLITLSGIERSMLLQLDDLQSITPERAVAAEDNWPPNPRVVAPVRPDEERSATTPSSGSGDEGDFELGRLLGLLHVFAADDPKRADRDARRQIAEAADAAAGRQDVDSLLVRYLHALSSGQDRLRKKGLRLRTLATMMSRFAPALVAASRRRLLTSMEASELEQLFMTVVLMKPTKTRPRTFAELRRFHRFLVRRHSAETVEWSEIARVAGRRNDESDPGTLTTPEAERVLETLLADLEDARACVPADPNEVRVRTLRVIAFLILEGSGIRPGSALGLTLEDVCLTDAGDYVQVRLRGTYAESKTDTAAGFIPLEGPIWERNRGIAFDWIAADRSRAGSPKQPVFARLRTPRTRYGRDRVLGRIGSLIRWVTADPRGRSYWLRKRCLQRKHRCSQAQEPTNAYDVFNALTSSGHASIHIALTSYLCDPALHVGHHLSTGSFVPPATAIAILGCPPVTYHQRLQRAKNGSARDLSNSVRMSAGLSIAGSKVLKPASLSDAPAPPIPTGPAHMSMLDVSRVCDTLGQDRSSDAISEVSNTLSYEERDVRHIVQVIEDFESVTGLGLGTRLKCPRRFSSTRAVRNLLRAKATPELGSAAQAWVRSVSRAPYEMGLVAPLPEDREIATAILHSLGVAWLHGSHQGVAMIQMEDRTWRALAWVLACCWIQDRSRRPRDLTDCRK